MKVAYAILAHERPELVARLVTRLSEAGGIVAIHYDAKAGAEALGAVEAEIPQTVAKPIWAKRVSVEWGEWSIVEATLNCVRAIFDAGHDPDYIHLMSGADYPIRPVKAFHAFLKRNEGTNFIELNDMASNPWVVDGLTHERYRYSHYFNWKRHPHLFDWSWKLQRWLRVRKRLPKDLKPHMGSQWCTLTGKSWKLILSLAQRRDVRKAFRRSWIPDEMIIQTLLATVKPRTSKRCMTLYQFTGQGVPLVFCNGHESYLAKQPFFFARKISPYAGRLRDKLDHFISGAESVTRFSDRDIGIRTPQYESFRQARRQAQPGRRTMGHVADPWYGDLEWNQEPYIVFMGASREELEWISFNLPRGGRFASHGALFAPNKINFMGGATRFAGYRDTDTHLRDHKRTNFLADVIQSSPGRMTTFALPWQSDDYIRDVARYDKRSHVVLVKGNIMRALLEREYLHFWSAIRANAPGKERPEPINIPSDEFRDFNERYEKFYTERRSQLQNGTVPWIEIDILSTGWRRQLGNFLTRIEVGSGEDDVNLGYSLAGSPAVHAPLLDPALAVRNIAENYALIPHANRRSCHLDLLLTRIKRPYAVIIGASREELTFVTSLLNRTGAFACHGSLFNPDHIEFHGNALRWEGFASSDTERRDNDHSSFLSSVMQSGDGKYAGFTIEWLSHPAFFDRIARDANAKILIVHGNQLRSFHEYVQANTEAAGVDHPPTRGPQRFEEFSRAHERYFSGLVAHLKLANIGYSEIDLLDPNFTDNLLDFLNGIDGKLVGLLPPEVTSRMSGWANALSDPASQFSNADFLYRRIADPDRRSAHVDAVRVGASGPCQPSGPTAPILDA